MTGHPEVRHDADMAENVPLIMPARRSQAPEVEHAG